MRRNGITTTWYDRPLTGPFWWEVDEGYPWTWRDFPAPAPVHDDAGKKSADGLPVTYARHGWNTVVSKEPRAGRRPRRTAQQRPFGLALLVAAVLVMVVNDTGFVVGSTPLPGGHSELYLFSGIGAAGLGAWLTSTFDTRGHL